VSDIRRSHQGYFGVSLALAVPWYGGLGVAFIAVHGGPVDAQAYDLVASYIPLPYWGLIYLTIGVGLLVSILVASVPHMFVRGFIGAGLVVTVLWWVSFVVSLAMGQLDAITVIPAWALAALVEWHASIEPEHGPKALHKVLPADLLPPD